MTRMMKRAKQQKREIGLEHPGAVCSECGRTVTQAEYSSGEAMCCHADVVPEEQFSPIEGAIYEGEI